MVFEGFSEKIQNIMQKVRGKTRITEDDVKEISREIKLALLEADVNFKVVKDFIAKVSEKAMGQDVLKSLKNLLCVWHLSEYSEFIYQATKQ